MAICPKCNEEIDGYRTISKEYIFQECFIQGDNLYYDPYFSEINETWFYCPDCDNLLFSNEEEAFNFLKNETLDFINT